MRNQLLLSRVMAIRATIIRVIGALGARVRRIRARVIRGIRASVSRAKTNFRFPVLNWAQDKTDPQHETDPRRGSVCLNRPSAWQSGILHRRGAYCVRLAWCFRLVRRGSF